MRMRRIPMMVGDEEGKTHCPTCGMSVRVVQNVDGYSDHYEPLRDGESLAQILPPQDEETADELRKLRQGKKTVALVGLSPTSCSLAPFDDPDVEIWGLNEAHAFPQWFKRWDRWFQIHESKSWKRYIAKRDIRGHYKWLKSFHYGEFESREQPAPHPWQDKNDFIYEPKTREGTYIWAGESWEKLKPIYMQYWNPEIPNVVAYPLKEVSDMAFGNFRSGDKRRKYFTSTFAYMMGIACLEDFERIEIYGFGFIDDVEYVKQKACAEFWIGYALGRDMEVYADASEPLLWSVLYGGAEQGAGW